MYWFTQVFNAVQFYYKSRVDNTYIDSMFSSWLDQELINFQIYLQGYLFIIIYIALTAITRLHRWQKKLKCTFLCKWWGEYLIFYIKAYKNICSFIEIIVLLLLKVFIKKEYKTPFLLTESLPWLALHRHLFLSMTRSTIMTIQYQMD